MTCPHCAALGFPRPILLPAKAPETVRGCGHCRVQVAATEMESKESMLETARKDTRDYEHQWAEGGGREVGRDAIFSDRLVLSHNIC